MIGLALALAIQASASPVAAAPEISTATLLNQCAAGIGGDMAMRNACEASVLGIAAIDRVEGNQPPPGGCFSTPVVSASGLVSRFMSWAATHPEEVDKPATAAVTAAMLASLPCGWKGE